MRRKPTIRWSGRMAALLLSFIAVACAPPRSQTSGLAVVVNELCTTCEDFIRCDSTAGTPEVPGPVTLYQLRPKGFVAQVATIWDFLIANIRERTEDRRPLTIFSASSAPESTGEAVTDLKQHRIRIPGGWIDQASGDWHGADDGHKGQCRIIPRPDGRQLMKELGGQGVR